MKEESFQQEIPYSHRLHTLAVLTDNNAFGTDSTYAGRRTDFAKYPIKAKEKLPCTRPIFQR